MDQALITVASASEHCRVCMQKKHGLCAEFCGSRAAEEASVILWIMTDFKNSL